MSPKELTPSQCPIEVLALLPDRSASFGSTVLAVSLLSVPQGPCAASDHTCSCSVEPLPTCPPAKSLRTCPPAVSQTPASAQSFSFTSGLASLLCESWPDQRYRARLSYAITAALPTECDF